MPEEKTEKEKMKAKQEKQILGREKEKEEKTPEGESKMNLRANEVAKAQSPRQKKGRCSEGLTPSSRAERHTRHTLLSQHLYNAPSSKHKGKQQ